ncbi:MAG: hypothetical protein RLN75_01710 [Longimicrobiales bacterium]
MRGRVRRVVGPGLVVVAVVGCGPTAADTPVDPISVEIFARGVVSSTDPEFATAFTPSGDTVFFNRTPPGRSRLELWVAVREGDRWGEPSPVPATVGMGAVDPFVSSDGATLWFSSGAPLDGAPSGDFNLWTLSRPPDGWTGTPVAVPRPVRSDSSEAFNTLTDDGLLVFGSTRDGERSIWTSRRSDDGWSEPTVLTLGGTTAASNPAIRRDGSLLVFARRGEAGDPDLWVACREDGGWGEPIRLPEPINSRWADFAPAFGPEHLYFTSERPGVVGPVADSIRPPGDIWRTPSQVVDGLCGG